MPRKVAAALDRLDPGIGKLIFAARIDPHVQVGGVDFHAVRPDTADAVNFPFAQGNGKTDTVGIAADGLLLAKAALAAAALPRDMFLELGRPDDLPGAAHPAIGLAHRRAL